MSDDETVQRLRDFREQLEAEVWSAATEAAAEYHVDQVTHLVQLKARIDALTWAIDHRPRERAQIAAS
ncbi:MAG: hypothetical protein ACK4VY_01005 [Brevundimonas sp.]